VFGSALRWRDRILSAFMDHDEQTTPQTMQARLTAAARIAAAGVATWAAWGARIAAAGLGLAWRLARPALGWALQVVLALLILLEEWGWQPLAALLGRLARWRPWARMEAAISGLPPYAALVVFALPSLLLLPLKFLALFLIANGRLVLAGLLFAAAKVGATALVARLFMLTRPALMQIGWFARAYSRFMPWKEAMEAYVRASTVWRVGRIWKVRAKRVAAVQWQRLRPVLAGWREAARAAVVRLIVQARRLGREIKTRWEVWGR
jgi:hypothetical protein